MDTGDCIRSHVGGADVDDGAVLSAEKSLVAIALARWGTVNLWRQWHVAPGRHCLGTPVLVYNIVQTKERHAHDQDVCE